MEHVTYVGSDWDKAGPYWYIVCQTCGRLPVTFESAASAADAAEDHDTEHNAA